MNLLVKLNFLMPIHQHVLLFGLYRNSKLKELDTLTLAEKTIPSLPHLESLALMFEYFPKI